MADGQRSTVRLGPSGAVVHVEEVERPTWGTIVYRSIDEPEVLYVEQLISVGPYKVDVPHAQQLTDKQLTEYAVGRLDFAQLAEAAMIELHRRPTAAPPAAETILRSAVGAWVDDQVTAAQSLAGQTIRSWTGVEMAIRSNDDETHFDFTDPQVPCLQLWGLTVEATSGTVTRLGKHQNDEDFGLTVTTPGEPLLREWRDGYRFRPLAELPTGLITTVATRLSDAGDLTEIEFGVGDEIVLIMAGEIYETSTERLEFHRFDESLLVFTSRADRDAIDWIPPI